MSTALACLLCNNRCSVARVAANFAFFPPSPPSYSFSRTASGGWSIAFASSEMQLAAEGLNSPVKVEPRYVETRNKQQVALIHFRLPGAQTTLLWSHGNAMDIGEMCARPTTASTVASRSPAHPA